MHCIPVVTGDIRARLAMVESLFDAMGKLGSESLAVYFTLPKHIARKKMAFPEDEKIFFS